MTQHTQQPEGEHALTLVRTLAAPRSACGAVGQRLNC